MYCMQNCYQFWRKTYEDFCSAKAPFILSAKNISTLILYVLDLNESLTKLLFSSPGRSPGKAIVLAIVLALALASALAKC